MSYTGVPNWGPHASWNISRDWLFQPLEAHLSLHLPLEVLLSKVHVKRCCKDKESAVWSLAWPCCLWPVIFCRHFRATTRLWPGECRRSLGHLGGHTQGESPIMCDSLAWMSQRTHGFWFALSLLVTLGSSIPSLGFSLNICESSRHSYEIEAQGLEPLPHTTQVPKTGYTATRELLNWPTPRMGNGFALRPEPRTHSLLLTSQAHPQAETSSLGQNKPSPISRALLSIKKSEN